MTVSEILTEVKREIDQVDTDAFSDTDLLNFFNEGYVDFCRFTQIKHKETDTTVTALQPWVALPSDMIQSTNVRWSYNRQLYPKSERTLDYDQRSWVFEVGTPENIVYLSWDEARIKPIPSAAGTVKYRHSYVPSALTSSESPDLPSIWEDVLKEFVKAQCFWTLRELDNGNASWSVYLTKRLKARAQVRQKSPDSLMTQRTTNVFNYGLWDQGYRVR